MSIESSIERWSSKRCPFGVSTNCITSECAAWRETESKYKDGYYEYDISDKKPWLFSDWEVYEVIESGGFYRDIVKDSEWGDIADTEWVPKSKSYKIRKWISKQLESEGYGYCGRM